jgi:hypothetical protein
MESVNLFLESSPETPNASDDTFEVNGQLFSKRVCAWNAGAVEKCWPLFPTVRGLCTFSDSHITRTPVASRAPMRVETSIETLVP